MGSNNTIEIANPTPLVMVHDSLWEMVDRNPAITSMVSTKNKIRFLTQDGDKREATTKDFPELVIMPASIMGAVRSNSTSTNLTAKYDFYIATNDIVITTHDTLQWEVMRALVDWDQVLCKLVWPKGGTRHFIIQAAEFESTIGLNNNVLNDNRGLRGWCSLLSVKIQMSFNTADMRIKTQEFVNAN